MIIRPIRTSDLDAFLKLALDANLGITNLPKNREILEKKIEASIEAFSKNISFPENEKYIFVLENSETGEIGGTCSILSQTAMTHPIYFYRIETISLKHDPKEIQILKPVSYKKEPSEIAGLFLHPSFRKSGIGKLLSLSRFLFIAAFRERFKNSFFAEIRGTISENHISPFWEGVGRHFINLDYKQLMKLAETGRGFIQDILPKYPIYIPLLPKDAQNAIGKAHESSTPALKMLQNEGFSFVNEIDIFDGGPRVSNKTNSIKTIKTSILAKIDAISDEEIKSERYLLGNERIEFRACFGELKFISKDTVMINKKVADSLQLKQGDMVRYVIS